jgi:hypothetical protein
MMKIKEFKIKPESLIALLRQDPILGANLPKDTELIDLKFDLLSNQAVVIVRSDLFTHKDKGEIELSSLKEESIALKTPAGLQCTSQHKSTPCKIADTIKRELSQYSEVLNFSMRANCVIAEPNRTLEDKWVEIDKLVQDMGGRWINDKVSSYWEIPVI